MAIVVPQHEPDIGGDAVAGALAVLDGRRRTPWCCNVDSPAAGSHMAALKRDTRAEA